jgi:antitoxin ParD1/3/4/toxin ParE1/3/4
MARFTLTDLAKSDIDEVVAYIRRDNRSAAKRVRAEIRDAMRQLADHPGLGHRRDDAMDETLRFWSVYSYLIVYRPSTKPLEIVRVFHGARDVGTAVRRIR